MCSGGDKEDLTAHDMVRYFVEHANNPRRTSTLILSKASVSVPVPVRAFVNGTSTSTSARYPNLSIPRVPVKVPHLVDTVSSK